MWKGKPVVPGVLAVCALACGPMAPETTSDESKTAGPELAGSRVVEKVTGGGQFVHPVFGTVTFRSLPPGMKMRW